jgi:hypothetical protein
MTALLCFTHESLWSSMKFSLNVCREMNKACQFETEHIIILFPHKIHHMYCKWLWLLRGIKKGSDKEKRTLYSFVDMNK